MKLFRVQPTIIMMFFQHANFIVSHKDLFHYLMMKLTLGSDMPRLIVTLLGTSNQAIPPIEELPIAGPHC